VQCGRCWKESEGVADRGVGFLEELSWAIFHTEEEGGRDLKVWSGEVILRRWPWRNVIGKRKFRKGSQENCRVNKGYWRNGGRSDRNDVGRSKSREKSTQKMLSKSRNDFLMCLEIGSLLLTLLG
jgi:hypothetical protein